MEQNSSAAPLAAVNQDTNPADVNFLVSGVQNIDLTGSTTGTSVMQLSIEAKNGTQEPVTLSADSLAQYTTVEFSPSTGTPPFTTSMTFNAQDSAQPGTFPFRLVATSQYLIRYNFINVTYPNPNPEGNFVVVIGDNMYQFTTSSWYQSQLSINNANGVSIAFQFSGSSPEPGTYTVVDWNQESPFELMQVGISFDDGQNVLYSSPNSTQVTITKDTSGKLQIAVPPIQMYGTANTTLYGGVHE